MTSGKVDPRRWIVVADSPFIPTHGGGEREHLGFVNDAVASGRVAALIVPTDADAAAVGRADDLDAISSLVAPAPVIITPRARSPLRSGLQPTLPYVVASRPAPADLVRQVAEAAPDADGVVVFSYKVHQLGRLLAEGLGLPAVLRQHNLEGAYHRSLAAAASLPRSLAYRLEALRIEADERRLEHCDWLSGIADISASDADLRARRSEVPVAYVPPFALDALDALDADQPAPASAADSRTVIFLGALDVSTNHDAIRWFARAVWPRVRAAIPDARWHVVGRRPSAAVQELVAATPGAELHADVADPAVHLRAAAVAVNPAVSGSGVNIKLVEYLATGLPVVSTARGTAGLRLESGRDLQVADDPKRFADAVISLLTDPAAATALGRSGRCTARQLMDTGAGLATIGRLLAGASRAGDDRGSELVGAEGASTGSARDGATNSAPVPRREPVEGPTFDDLEVVLVSYRSRPHVEALLADWPEQIRVAVVDNSANSDGLAEFAADDHRVRCLDGGGQGFARAANLAARSSDRPYLVFVNPDSRPTAEDLLALVRGLDGDPAAVSHAATVTDADGQVEIGVGGWEPSIPRLAVNAIGLHKVLRRAGLFAEPRLGERIEPGWTTGACMAVRTHAFLALGGFDETFFVYAEDMAFGRRARAAGWRCRLRADVVVRHGAGNSGAPSREMLRLRGASFAGYLRRYHPGVRGTVMRGLFAAGALARGVAQAATGRTAQAELNLALLRGTLTQRAFVGGVEVARARFDQITR